jgi:hypothetical protein
MLVTGLSFLVSVLLRYMSSIPNFFMALIMKRFWISLKAFLCLLSWLCDYCPLFYLRVVIHLLISRVVQHLKSWNEIVRSWCIVWSSMHWWIWLDTNLLRIFVSIFTRKLA